MDAIAQQVGQGAIISGRPGDLGRPRLAHLGEHLGIRLWLAHLDEDLSADEAAVLCEEELQRAARHHREEDRRRRRVARWALRIALAQTLGLEPGTLRFQTDPQGKPHLAGSGRAACHFNLSHAQDLALIGVCAQAPVGVDLEVLAPVADLAGVSSLVFTPAERDELARQAGSYDTAFLRGWTRKEACLKAVGTGLGLDPAGVEVGLSAQDREVRLHLPSHGAPAIVALRSLPASGTDGTQTPWVAAVARLLGTTGAWPEVGGVGSC
jgi:4'-phosphopantetheinyl transferase